VLFDHLVSGHLHYQRHRQPKRLGVLRLITNSNLVACITTSSMTELWFGDP
jgi:hypothetical protein